MGGHRTEQLRAWSRNVSDQQDRLAGRIIVSVLMVCGDRPMAGRALVLSPNPWPGHGGGSRFAGQARSAGRMIALLQEKRLLNGTCKRQWQGLADHLPALWALQLIGICPSTWPTLTVPNVWAEIGQWCFGLALYGVAVFKPKRCFNRLLLRQRAGVWATPGGVRCGLGTGSWALSL